MSIYLIRNTYRTYLILFIQCTLCYGWRVGFVHSKCNRIRVNRLTGIESDFTSPYFTLNFTYTTVLLPLRMPPLAPNEPPKHEIPFPNEKRRYGRGAVGRSDFPEAFKPTSGGQKTAVFIGWGAIWPSFGPSYEDKVHSRLIYDRPG